MNEGYISIKEAARRLDMSDKTIRRYIQAGKIGARYPKKNLAEVAAKDVEALRGDRPAMIDVAPRIQELERRVQELERLVQSLLEQKTAAQTDQEVTRIADIPATRQFAETAVSAKNIEPIAPDPGALAPVPARKKTSRSKSKTALPEGLDPIYSFANLHHMPQSLTIQHIRTGVIRAVRGKWKMDGNVVTTALDARGRREFWSVYHKLPGFTPCDQCPHEIKDDQEG